MRAAQLFIPQVPRLDSQELRRFVQSFLDRRGAFLEIARNEGSPLYVIDSDALRSKAREFRKAFSEVLSDVRVYYALKCNSHPTIATTLVREGLGIDVSSGLELQTALSCGADDIIFSGPGKQPDELKLAVENASRVTVLIDSFRELGTLDEIAKQSHSQIRAGVRLTTDETGIWRKFGIPLRRLQEFFSEARKHKHVNLKGLQFHSSWNLNPKSQTAFIVRLGRELRRLDKEDRQKIGFIDVGGGFWPEEGEWLQFASTPRGMLHSAIGANTVKCHEHYRMCAAPIEKFANQIAAALKRHLPGDMKCTFCFEPGRWLCNDSMHILLTVADVKSRDVVITDGGTNAVGWERFEADFVPVINLSCPGLDEHECLVAGSLCTPHDLWGYSYFGEGIHEGDILLVPNQGAYTYSLRQEFIKPLPNSIILPDRLSRADASESNVSHVIGRRKSHEGHRVSK
jgi:diaminopimelate decarboxylase